MRPASPRSGALCFVTPLWVMCGAGVQRADCSHSESSGCVGFQDRKHYLCLIYFDTTNRK